LLAYAFQLISRGNQSSAVRLAASEQHSTVPLLTFCGNGLKTGHRIVEEHNVKAIRAESLASGIGGRCEGYGTARLSQNFTSTKRSPDVGRHDENVCMHNSPQASRDVRSQLAYTAKNRQFRGQLFPEPSIAPVCSALALSLIGRRSEAHGANGSVSSRMATRLLVHRRNLDCSCVLENITQACCTPTIVRREKSVCRGPMR
jgi:hypothetical protein